MQTNVVLDSELVAKAMRIFRTETESEAVRSALELGVQVRGQEAILELWGMGWEGDLEEMRLDKPSRTID